MREMVLNHASLVRATGRETDAWLKDVAAGITVLVRSGAVQKVLRTDRPVYEIPCAAGRSLWEAWYRLRREGRQRPEEVRLLGGLLTKCSFLGDTSSEPVGCKAEGCGSSSLTAQSVSPAAARQEAIGSVKAW